MEILILHPGALGDIVLSLPAIGLLRAKFPPARLTMAGNVDHLAAIVSGYADRVVSLATLPLHRLHAGETLPQEDVTFWKSYDRIVSWTGSGDPGFIRKFREIHSNVCIASWRPKPGEERHVSQLFADSLDLEVPSGAMLSPAHILLDEGLRSEGKRWLEERGWNGHDFLTALHPGAGSKAKRWPVSRFISLARHLVVQEKSKLLTVEGPAEPGLANPILQALPEGAAIPAVSVPLNLLAAVLEQCGAFVGNDSGIAHLAAALKIRCIVLFGPTLPQHWAPLGQNVAVLRNPQNCEGCASGANHHTCMDNITVEDVIRYK